MYSRLRSASAESALTEVSRLQALEQAVPWNTVSEILQHYHCQERRLRKLSMGLLVYLLIAMNLFARERLALVLGRLMLTFRWLVADASETVATDAALVYRRKQLGVAPLVALFHRVCKPLATEQTQGAFLFGLRLMALDGKQIHLYDTPPLADYFGRPSSSRGQAAFPQARLVSLVEVGTHATIDAGVWPLSVHEREGAKRLVRSLIPGMLLLVDRGLYSIALVRQVRARGAHVLFRLPKQVKPQFLQRLSDGSWLVRLADDPQIYRLIRYTFRDPSNPGHGQTYRLLTTLLDPRTAPGQELAVAYHERWGIEEVYDETQTHLLRGDAPLRSRSVTGVLQEIYALLLAHYCVRAVIHDAALLAQVDPDRLSFTATVVVIQETIPLFQMAAPTLHPVLYERMLEDIAAQPVQQRPPRSYPRVVKRKMSNFPLKSAGQHGRKCSPYRRSVRLI